MKPKPVLLAPRNMVRELTSEADVERLLRSGSWCRVAGTKPISKSAAWQRQFRARNRELGIKMFTIWLPDAAITAFLARRKLGESNTELFLRLFELSADVDVNPMVGTDNLEN